MSPAVVSYDAMVAQLTALGFPRDKAEARARAEHPITPAETAQQLRRANVLEKQEQAAITKMARAIGMTVRSTSQARPSKIAHGLPDLVLSHRGHGFFGWWETKRQLKGVRSTAQAEFGDDCLAAHVPYGFGDRYSFARWLEDHGFTATSIPMD